MKPWESKGCSARGASMGRRSDPIPRGTVVQLERVYPLDSTDGSDYDAGGAYWGELHESPLFCAYGETDDEQIEAYFRAADFAAATAHATAQGWTIAPDTSWRARYLARAVAAQISAAASYAETPRNDYWCAHQYREARAWYDAATSDEPIGLDSMLDSYVTCALWSSVESRDDDDENYDRPMDENHSPSDIAPETMEEMRRDCAEFLREHAADIGENQDQAGHDFWLSRNGHGAGFSDRECYDDSPDPIVKFHRRDFPIAERLRDAAREWGEIDLYVDDDGKVRA